MTDLWDLKDLTIHDVQPISDLSGTFAAAMNCARGTEAGAYLRLIDSCITQLKAQGPARTCNESKEEEWYLRRSD